MTAELVPVPGLRRPEQGRSGAAIAQLLGVVFKWRRLILGLCLAFTAAAAIAMVLKPTLHSATARILFKPDRIPLQISGLVAQSSRLPHSPQMLQSEVEMMKSREVLLPAARTLLAAEASPEDSVSPERLQGVVHAFDDDLQVVAVPDTNVIQVSYFSPDAAEAERRLGLIVDHYLQQRGQANSGSQKLLQFFEDEAHRVGQALQTAEDGLRQWQQQFNVVNVDTQISGLLTMQSDREKALRQTDAEIEATTARLAALDAQRAATPERVVTSHERVRNPLVAKFQEDVAAAEVAVKDVERDPLVGKLRTDLAAAEVALQDLRQRYLDGDRRVQDKREQVTFLRTELASAQRAAAGTAQSRLDLLRRDLAAAEQQGEIVGRELTELNPVREELDKAASTTRAQLTSLTAQRAVLARQHHQASAAVAAIRDKKVEADRRSREVDMRREAFQLYGRRLEEARVAAGLESEQLASVAVIEQPYATEATDTRRRLAMVLLAGVVGLGLGVAFAFGIEFVGNRLRTVGDVEYYLGVPVLAAIPDSAQRALPASGGALARLQP
jgi:uncharacterized protein involved in exopolysaccharide biosynthesis